LAVSLPKKLLVAVEGSEPSLKESSMKAARYALELAAASGASLLAVCVVQIPEYIEEHTRASLRDELSRKGETTLKEIGELSSKSGVPFASRVIETSGSISTAICSLAEKESVDLVVLGTRSATSSLTKMMLGSVASGVAGNAHCPVLVVR
jgi:nucleotide-binding universal stress UspA family protein